MLKSVAHWLVSNPSIGASLWRVHRRRSASLMLHRFRDNERGVSGHDPETLRSLLGYLRKCRIPIVAVDAQVKQALALSEAPDHRPTVSFTVDDGYYDVAEVALPVFEEFDVPFTVFVTPGMIDQHSMYWWDQVEWMLANAQTQAATIEFRNKTLRVSWHDLAERKHAQRELVACFKTLAPDNMEAALAELASQLDVDLPSTPPPAFHVLGWDQLRALEARGAVIGAHSMTHPILSLCDDRRAEWEITESMLRVRSEAVRPSEVFCYPNGITGDFSDREAAILQRCGAIGAVTAVPGLLWSGQQADESLHDRWALSRVPYDVRPGTLYRAFFD